ncbi:hypothetical protein LTR85_000987 [Meristemomyces frigidus]|nr:hypothetical protein LTR85_000987 [Meristemomyces frigidus]
MAHAATFLVLGATGGTGKHFVARALANGHKVRALVRTPSKLPPAGHEKLEARHGSITDDNLDTDALVAGVDYVVSMLGDVDAQKHAKINTAFVKKLVPSMRLHGVRRFLYQAGGLSRPHQGQLPPLLWVIRYTLARGYGGQHEDNEAVMAYLATEADDIEWIVHRAGIGSDGPSKGLLQRSNTSFSVATFGDCAEYSYRTVMDDAAVHTAVNGEKTTVIVGSGDDVRTYTVPKALLCNVGWFRAALEGGRFQEGVTGSITLPEDKPEAFEAMQYYLYYGELEFGAIADGVSEVEWLDRELKECLHISVFGDKYDIPALENAVILRLCDVLTNRAPRYADKDDKFDNRDLEVPSATLELYYASTSAGSPLRMLMADYVVSRVRQYGMLYSHFEKLEAFDGFAEEYASAQTAYEAHARNEHGTNFPRYLQPYKYGELFCFEEEAEEEEEDAAHANAFRRYGGIHNPPRTAWGHSFSACTRCLNGGADECFVQLCGDCGNTYKKQSVEEKDKDKKFVDALVRSNPALALEIMQKMQNGGMFGR